MTRSDLRLYFVLLSAAVAEAVALATGAARGVASIVWLSLRAVL